VDDPPAAFSVHHRFVSRYSLTFMRRGQRVTVLLLLLASGGCKSAASQSGDASSSTAARSGATASPPGEGLLAGRGSGAPRASMDAGSGSLPTALDAAARDASRVSASDGGVPDAASQDGTMPHDRNDDDLDGGSAPDAASNAGTVMRGVGGCCTEHDTPGCSNADLEVCVCEKLPSCCTGAWNRPCVLIVEQKFCQAGVRECVCGQGDGQWAQTSCCESDWTDTFCDQVAESKCGAVRGCL